MRQAFQSVEDAPVSARNIPGRMRFCGLAHRVIEARMPKVLASAPVMRDPRNSDDLHRMRIAAKHLRCCMEACMQLYDGRLGRPIKIAKAI